MPGHAFCPHATFTLPAQGTTHTTQPHPTRTPIVVVSNEVIQNLDAHSHVVAVALIAAATLRVLMPAPPVDAVERYEQGRAGQRHHSRGTVSAYVNIGEQECSSHCRGHTEWMRAGALLHG